jgi:NADP-dependent 3-hydroxy acid dehydrogenase YdfG
MSKIMSKIAGKCICITGGASGVGKIMGQIALEKGARQLVIWDINPDNIEKTIDELSSKGNEVSRGVSTSYV